MKKLTRREKAQAGLSVVARKAAKVQWTESYGINQFVLTQSQAELSNKILQNDLVFCEGPAGTGKSLAVLYTYVKQYLQDNSKQIVFIRTPVEAGMDKIGALPDSLEAKIEPHFAAARNLLEQLLSKGKVETDLSHRLHFKIPNYCLGATFDNALICIDEAQQLPPTILKLLLERTGMNSKVVVLGDNSQLYTDSRGRNALLDAIPRFFDIKNQYKPKFDYVDYHKFEVDDVQRSDIVKSVIRAYSTGVLPLRNKTKSSSSDDELTTCFFYNDTKVVNSVDVYIDEAIGDVPYYRNLLHYLRNMEKGDELRIWIDSDGGYIDSALAIVQAMNNTEGDVMVIISGKCHSAAGLIALGAPSLIVQENAHLMVHTASYGIGPSKAANINSQVEFYTKQIASTIRQYYKHFMTDAEIEDTLNGKDFWFDSNEIVRRLEVRAKAQEADANDAQSVVETQQIKPKRKRKVDTSIKPLE